MLTTFTRKLRQLGVTAVHEGPTSAVYWAAFGYLRPNTFVIFTHDLRCLRTQRVAGVRFDVWPAARLAAWRKGQRRLSSEFFRDRIDGVRRCAVALDDDNVVGLIWFYEPGDPSRMFRLFPGQAELNYGYLQPAFRHRGIFTSTVVTACLRLRAEGHTAAFVAVHAANGPSRRAFAAAGFATVAEVKHFFLFRPAVEWRTLTDVPALRPVLAA
jgi:L-amino acid N-acyltransferase YncA